MSARSRGMEICFIWMLNICLGLHLLVSKTRGLEAKRPCRQSLKKHKDSCLLLGIVTSSYLISSASHLTKKTREFSWQGCTWKPAGRGALEGSSGRKEVTVRKRKSKATTKSQEEVKCRVRQKRLNSQLFGWGQWERKHVIFQQEQEEIFWDQLLPSLLSEMLWWQSRTEFCWRNQRLIFAKKNVFLASCVTQVYQGLPILLRDTGWFGAGSSGNLCLSTADAGVLVGHTLTSPLVLHTGVSVSAGGENSRSMWTSSQLKKKPTFISAFNKTTKWSDFWPDPCSVTQCCMERRNSIPVNPWYKTHKEDFCQDPLFMDKNILLIGQLEVCPKSADHGQSC